MLANTGSGLVQAATLLLDVVNTVNGGRVLATGSADVKGTTLNNTGTLQGADLLVNYHTFSNSGTLLGTSGLGVKGSSLLQNGTGRLYSAGNLLLDAQDFSGQGQVVATGDVTLKLIAALTNHGTWPQGKPFPSRRKMPSPTAVSCRVMPWCSVPERHSPTMER